MSTVPLDPDLRPLVIGFPDDVARQRLSKRLGELCGHVCMNYGNASHGELFRWSFRQGERRGELAVTGLLIATMSLL